jgi:hypothetical protein
VSAPLLALALLAGAAPAAGTGAPATRIASLQLEASGVPPEMAESATLLVPTEVRRVRPDAQVISSEDVRSLLTHQRNQMVLGCGNDPACMRDVGGKLGADEIVGGRLGKLGGIFVLEMRRVDARQATNIRSVTRTVRSADSLVGAVRSATAELFGAPPGEDAQVAAVTLGEGQAPAAGPGGGAPPALYAPPSDDEGLPRPSLEDDDLDFKPIPYRGIGNRAVYDVVRSLLAGARIPVARERADDDALLHLRTEWLRIEKGRRVRLRVRIDGRVNLDVDRQKCDERGCDETWDVSSRERKLATDLYAVLRGPVEKGTF